MKPEKNQLLHTLLEDGAGEARRAAILHAGNRILRRKRWVRASRRLGFLAAVILLVALTFFGRRPGLPRKASPSPATVPAFAVKHLSDDQLLALFPGVPVGLVGVGDRKVLVFPRPTDEARFLRRF